MTKVRVNGATLVGVDEIKDGVCNAFHALLSKSGDWRSSSRGLCFVMLGSDSSESLEEPFLRWKFSLLFPVLVGMRLQVHMVLP